MKIALFKESRTGETRVALTPDAVKSLVGDGWDVVVQRGAGERSHFVDATYEAAGATISDAPLGDVNLRVNPPTVLEAAQVPESSLHLSFLSPLLAQDIVKVLNERKVTVLSFDLLPRISRAQYMDALSSQATVSGYRAALAGASHSDRFFPLLTTAVGTTRPAKVLVMGVGVAGLQAIATAKRLGAKVRAYDVRSAAKEEAESAGAVFVKLGVTADAAGGYARELTAEERAQQQAALAGEVVERHGVRVVGLANPPSQMGAHASFMYANNVLKLLALFGAKGQLAPDWTDEVVVGVTVASDGHVRHAPTAEALGVAPVALAPEPPAPEPPAPEPPAPEPKEDA